MDSEGSPSATTRKPRHPIFQTCGVSFLAILHNAYTRVQELHGPIGSLAQILATLTGPIAYIIQYQWLAILYFFDDQILAIENVFETIFPPSAYVFDKLVDVVETLPGRFDNVVNEFSVMISTLTDWGFHDAKEKEFLIDIKCSDHPSELALEEKPLGLMLDSIEMFPPIGDTQPTKTKSSTPVNVATDKSVRGGGDGGGEAKHGKITSKEVMKNGKKGSGKRKEEEGNGGGDIEQMESIYNVQKDGKKSVKRKEERGKEIMKAMVNKDEVEAEKENPILELFDAGWHTKSPRGSKRSQ